MHHPTDGEIIAAARREPERFEEIFDRHFHAVVRFASGRVGFGEAGDVAAETFARAFRRRSRFDTSRDSALPWLFGIAMNVSRETRRREERRHRALSRMTTGITSEAFEHDADARLDARTMLPRLAEALQGLSDEEYTVLVLVALSELTYREIAEHLRIPIGTVRSRLARARRRSRELLEAYRPITEGPPVTGLHAQRTF